MAHPLFHMWIPLTSLKLNNSKTEFICLQYKNTPDITPPLAGLPQAKLTKLQSILHATAQVTHVPKSMTISPLYSESCTCYWLVSKCCIGTGLQGSIQSSRLPPHISSCPLLSASGIHPRTEASNISNVHHYNYHWKCVAQYYIMLTNRSPAQVNSLYYMM